MIAISNGNIWAGTVGFPTLAELRTRDGCEMMFKFGESSGISDHRYSNQFYTY